MVNTRASTARELGTGEDILRFWERSRALPIYGTVSVEAYRERAGLILAGRSRGLSLQSIRRTLFGVTNRETL
jgi:hypothetical protein